MTTLAIVVAVVLVAGVVGWFVLQQRQHPENAATHRGPETTTTDESARGVDRPAGPDAETMDPDQLGGDQRPPSS